MAGRIWDKFLTKKDKAVFAQSGLGNRNGFGKRPVLLVIDVNYIFVGDRPEPVLEAIKRWPAACGESGWDALPIIQELLETARKKRVPVIYTTGEMRPDRWDRGSWDWKNSRGAGRELQPKTNLNGNDIVAEIAPTPQDIIVNKIKPSGFFGTNLESFLNLFHADSLIVAGTTTSGCVRATVLDAFSLNYRVTVVEDACFDRSEASHAINLCDINAKYADVIMSDEVINYINNLPDALFDLPSGEGMGRV